MFEIKKVFSYFVELFWSNFWVPFVGCFCGGEWGHWKLGGAVSGYRCGYRKSQTFQWNNITFLVERLDRSRSWKSRVLTRWNNWVAIVSKYLLTIELKWVSFHFPNVISNVGPSGLTPVSRHSQKTFSILRFFFSPMYLVFKRLLQRKVCEGYRLYYSCKNHTFYNQRSMFMTITWKAVLWIQQLEMVVFYWTDLFSSFFFLPLLNFSKKINLNDLRWLVLIYSNFTWEETEYWITLFILRITKQPSSFPVFGETIKKVVRLHKCLSCGLIELKDLSLYSCIQQN